MGKEIDKAELATKIQSIKELDSDTRAALLALVNGRKKYGLVWEEHTEEVEEKLRNELPVLVEDDNLFIDSNEEDAPNHILIEGDNLHALTALSYTHAGKIDVIYIDPPYNTGNKDFVYNDSFVDSEDDYRHSKWLSFMSKRLKIAKTLLSDKGVIFISIDDNEQANLKLLCDDVFGNLNFLASVIWEKADSPRMDAKDFSTKHDYILVYCKNKLTEPIKKLRSTNVPDHYNKTDERGNQYYLKPLRYMGNADSREDRPKMYYPIEAPDGTLVYPLRADGSDGRWRWGMDKLEKEKERLEFIKTKKGWSIYSRIYAELDAETPVETIWYNQDVDSNRQAIAVLKSIFDDEKVFSNPKPVKLINRVLTISSNSNSTILDFFAGSGTTLHATMKLNEEDGGHRQCILVTNNENNICRNITYERNRRVIQGYTNSKGVDIPGLTANKLRYYKTDFVERQSSVTAKKKLMAAATDMLCIKNNIYTKQTNFNGKAYREKDVRYFAEGDNQMLIIYNIDIIEEIINEIDKMDVTKPIIVYVFSTNDYAYEADFADVQSKVNLCALPEAIYRAYLQVLPQRHLI